MRSRASIGCLILAATAKARTCSVARPALGVGAILLSIFAASSDARSRTLGADENVDIFRAIDVEGEVLTWPPWETGWVELKTGDLLIAGTLVQSLGSAKIIVQNEKQGALKEGDDALAFSFTVPTMLRIHAQLARHVRTSSMMIDARKTGLPSVRHAPKNRPPPMALINAWRRVKSVGVLLSQLTSQTTSALTAEDKNHEMSVSTPQLNLLVKTPRDGSLLIADEFPLEIAVKWDVEEGKKRPREVAAYVWPTEGARGDPVMRTSATTLPVHFTKAGNYFIQLQTDGGEAESPLIMVTVE